MRQKYFFMLPLLAVVLLIYGGVVYSTEAAPETIADVAPASGQREQAGGLRVYIDPLTGKRTAPPPANPASGSAAPTAAPVTRSLQVQLPTRTVQPKIYDLGPGKGRAIDMRGHFNRSKAVIGSDGKLERACESAPHSQ